MAAIEKKKAILITGCDSGFGFSLASHLSETKPDILTIACCYFPGGVSKGANILDSMPNVKVLKLDVTDEGSIAELVVNVEATLKEENAMLWSVVNNAATLVFADVVWQTRGMVKQQFDVNVIGCWSIAQAFTPHLMESNGRLVNMVSFCTECPLPTLSIYTATKAALMSLSNGMRMELAKYGISVILFNPGDHPGETPLCKGQEAHYDAMKAEVVARFKDHPDVLSNFGKYQEKFANLFPPSPTLKKLESPGFYKEFDRIAFDQNPGYFYVNSDLVTRGFFGLLKLLPTSWSDYARITIMKLPK